MPMSNLDEFNLGSQVFVIAEISGNHGGVLENAKQLILDAKDSGANAVKFQAYTPSSITLDSNKEDFLIPKNNAWEDYENLYSLYVKAHTPYEWIPELISCAKSVGIPIFASVFDVESIEILEAHNIFAYKIASPEVSDINIVKRVAKTKKPVFISTGLSDLAEIYKAHKLLMDNGSKQIYWLKANTSYPPPIEEINLRTIKNLSETLNCQVGFSDHTLGFMITIAAVAAGARIIEKHLKLDNDTKTVDDFFSLGKGEFTEMVSAIRQTEIALGDISYDIPPSSRSYLNGKRSIYVSANIKKGERFTLQNVKSVRPSFSLATEYLPLILNSRARKDLELGDRLTLSDLEIISF
jgi:N-acetylneuraminate synthase/pseudaminic acid synthase